MTDGKAAAVKTKSFISKKNTQNRPEPIQPSFIRKDRTIKKCGSRGRSVKLASAHDTWRADVPGKIGSANIEKASNRVSFLFAYI